VAAIFAFSSEVDTGSRGENASNQKAPLLLPSEAESLKSACEPETGLESGKDKDQER
jgi:hypothetical protein